MSLILGKNQELLLHLQTSSAPFFITFEINNVTHKINKQIQAKHVLVVNSVAPDQDGELGLGNFLWKLNGLGNSIRTRLNRTLDRRVRMTANELSQRY